MKIGDRIFVHGVVDEIRGDNIIIHNEGGYFGTIQGEVEEQSKYEEAREKAYEEGYKTGCKDGWGLAAKIEGTTCGQVHDVFGIEEDNSAWLCNQISYDEALARYREWKEINDWRDIPADDMTIEQAREAVKSLRAELGRRLNLQ